MPISTIAETTRVKRRLLSDSDHHFLLAPPNGDGGGGESNSSSNNNKRQYVVRQLQEDDDEDVDFVLSIGEDGDWDYTITTTTASTTTTKEKEEDVPPPPPTEEEHTKNKRLHHTNRPASPFAGCDSRLCEELYMMSTSATTTTSSRSSKDDEEDDACYCQEEEELLRVSSYSSLGNNLKISMSAIGTSSHDRLMDGEATSSSAAAAAANTMLMLPTPLITPPSSPRRIRTVSYDGVTTEEATICEWPCNLTVDNAITAALENAPLTLPLGSSCCADERSR